MSALHHKNFISLKLDNAKLVTPDSHKSYDPYCVVGLADNKGQKLRITPSYTSQIKLATANPEWKASFEMYIDFYLLSSFFLSPFFRIRS